MFILSLNAHLLRVDKNTKKSAEESEVRDDETEISRLFGSEQMHIHRCLKCGQEATKHSIMLLCNLVYPEIVNPCKLFFLQVRNGPNGKNKFSVQNCLKLRPCTNKLINSDAMFKISRGVFELTARWITFSRGLESLNERVSTLAVEYKRFTFYS